MRICCRAVRSTFECPITRIMTEGQSLRTSPTRFRYRKRSGSEAGQNGPTCVNHRMSEGEFSFIGMKMVCTSLPTTDARGTASVSFILTRDAMRPISVRLSVSIRAFTRASSSKRSPVACWSRSDSRRITV